MLSWFAHRFSNSLVADGDAVCLHDSIYFEAKLGKTRHSLGPQLLYLEPPATQPALSPPSPAQLPVPWLPPGFCSVGVSSLPLVRECMHPCCHGTGRAGLCGPSAGPSHRVRLQGGSTRGLPSPSCSLVPAVVDCFLCRHSSWLSQQRAATLVHPMRQESAAICTQCCLSEETVTVRACLLSSL